MFAKTTQMTRKAFYPAKSFVRGVVMRPCQAKVGLAYLQLKEGVSGVRAPLSRGDYHFLIASQHLLQQPLHQHQYENMMRLFKPS